MINFFFKRKKIVVDAFTTNIHAYDMFPIQPAKKFIPKWFKDLPNKYCPHHQGLLQIERSTMKGCLGFVNMYKDGFVMPMWTDLAVRTEDHGFDFQAADNVTIVDSHDPEQYGNHFPELAHIKIMSPWRMREKRGVKFLYMQNPWDDPTNMFSQCTPPGIINFKHQHTTHVNMMVKKGHTFNWSANTPMVQMIPLSEHDVSVKNHVIGPTEMMRIMTQSGFPFFVNGYVESKKARAKLKG